MKSKLLLAVIFITLSCQCIFSQEAVVTSQSATLNETQNLSQADLRKLQKNLFFPELNPSSILEPEATFINFDDVIINSENSGQIAPNRYAGVSFYAPGNNTWATYFTSYSYPNSLVVGYLSSVPFPNGFYPIISPGVMYVDFAPSARNVAFRWGTTSDYNVGAISLYGMNYELIASFEIGLPNSWNYISLNQYGNRIRRIVLSRPGGSYPAGRGHINLDNFQFEPITTQQPIGFLDAVSIEQAAQRMAGRLILITHQPAIPLIVTLVRRSLGEL